MSTYTRRGGAALGALFLHKALLQEGVDSKLCTKDGDDDPTIIEAPLKPVAVTVQSLMNKSLRRIYRKADWPKFSHSLAGVLDLPKTIKRVQPELLHIHWVNGGFLNLSALNKIRVPIVVTLRDFWFFTGGCHYPSSCSRLEFGCGCCPMLGSKSSLDLSRFQMLQKKKLQSRDRVHFVAISNDMKHQLESRFQLGTSNVSVIGNCIPFDEFYPSGKKDCRRHLGIEEDSKVVFLPALHPWSSRKGGDVFLDAIRSLMDFEITVLSTGHQPEIGCVSSMSNNVKFLRLPLANTSEEMRVRYCAADVVAVPSRDEAFGKVTAEALACGRPAVAFQATGASDIIAHRSTGYLADEFTSKELSNGLRWTLQNFDDRPETVKLLRDSVTLKFSTQVIAKEYMHLYERAIRN